MIDPDRSVQDRLARLFASCVEAGTHNPRQHRDGKPPWCRVCGLTTAGKVPISYLERYDPPAAPARAEASLERSFNDAVQKAGGEPVKLSPANRSGIPDRFVIWPGGVVDLVELKRDGEEPGRLQQEIHRQLNRMGHDIYLVSGERAIKHYVAARLRETIPSSLPGRVARFES